MIADPEARENPYHQIEGNTNTTIAQVDSLVLEENENRTSSSPDEIPFSEQIENVEKDDKLRFDADPFFSKRSPEDVRSRCGLENVTLKMTK